jgi:regulator of replication initiation timing
MSDRFDFEETLTKCWCVVDDLKELSEHIIEHNVVGNDTIHNHIFGLATVYDVKFHKLWDLYESQYMETIRENKFLNEECAALRQQLQESNSDTHGYGIAAIKPNKKDKK